MSAYQASLVPADAKAFGVIIDRLFQFVRTFGIGNPDVVTATRFYRQGLADLPADLLSEAVDAIVRDWRWGAKLPLPADLRNAVADELQARSAPLRRLEVLKRFKMDEPKPQARRVPSPQASAAREVVMGSIPRPPAPELSEAEQEAAFQRERQRLLDEMAADPDFAEAMGR